MDRQLPTYPHAASKVHTRLPLIVDPVSSLRTTSEETYDKGVHLTYNVEKGKWKRSNEEGKQQEGEENGLT